MGKEKSKQENVKESKFLTEESLKENTGIVRPFKEKGKRRYVTAEQLQEVHVKSAKKVDENGVVISRATGKPVKKNRGSDIPTVKELDNGSVKEVTLNMMPIMQLPRCKTDEQLIERYDWLIEYIAETGLQPSMDAFCLAFDIFSGTARDWKAGKCGQLKSLLVKKYQLFSQSILFQATAQNKLNPVVWMFYSKNWFDYSDKREVEVIGTQHGALSEEEERQIIDDLPSTDVIDI